MFHAFPPLTLAGLLLIATPGLAAEHPTCSTSTHPSGWTMLNSHCDIGQGLWGRKPNNEQGQFWVQCNYSKALPDTAFLRILQQSFPEQHYLYKDGDHYRCLIGPLDRYTLAQQTKAKLIEQGITNAFIRHQTSGSDTASLPINPEKARQPLSAEQQLAATRLALTDSAQTYPEVKASHPSSQEALPSSIKTLIAHRTVLDAAVYSFTFDNLNFYLPRNIQSTQAMPPAFVKEFDQYWSRVPLVDAKQWCQRYGLRLPSFDELKHLQTYGQRFLLRNHWPITYSYWTDSISHYSGEIQALNVRNGRADEYRPRALLYTACVNSAS